MRWPWQKHNPDTVVVSCDWFTITKHKNSTGPNNVSLEFTKPWMKQNSINPIRMTEADAAELAYGLDRIVRNDS